MCPFSKSSVPILGEDELLEDDTDDEEDSMIMELTSLWF